VDSSGPQTKYFPSCVIKASPDHLYWLTLVAFSDRRTNSTYLYKNFARMFQENISLFKRGQNPSYEEMQRLFRAYTIALPQSEIAFFLERKKHLDSFFEGNPLKIYEGITDVKSLMIKLRKVGRENQIKNIFPGAKEKIFCLLAMFLSELVDLKFDDTVPVDVWVQSITASTDTLTGSGHIKVSTLEAIIRPLLSSLFKKIRNLDPKSSNATYLLGKHGCTHCAGKDMTKLCPVYALCKGPFERARHPISEKHLGVVRLPLIQKGKHTP
jgi:hypothetical protein